MTDSTAISISNLTYRYGSGQEALREISFVIQPGERVGLVGPSGAGKSTLLLHLNGLLPETHPRTVAETESVAVMVGGLPVCKTHLPVIRQQVGLVFQDPDDQLFCPTVEEDIAFGPMNLGLSQAEVQERVRESLELVGLKDYATRSTLQLSMGERRRVCLAGVLACKPDLLAMDEPFSNLDPRSRRQLRGILEALSSTQILATHDLNLVVELCERVLLLDQGKLIADGPAERILSDAALMEQHGLEVPWRIRWSQGQSHTA